MGKKWCKLQPPRGLREEVESGLFREALIWQLLLVYSYSKGNKAEEVLGKLLSMEEIVVRAP